MRQQQEKRVDLIWLNINRGIRQMKQSSLIISGFFRQLSKYSLKKYYSQPDTIQSSVGMIFRFPDIRNLQTKQQFDTLLWSQQTNILQNTQLLFVQRAGYHSDRNAYNVVFPGGQCDSKQTDLEACQRQLKEQIGINTDQQCVHLGQLPKNFYYLKKKGKQVFISCHAYFLKSTSLNWQPKLNPDQLRKFKWVKIQDLLKSQNYHKRNQIKIGVFQRMPAFASRIAKQNITQVSMPQLDLGMDRNLWGITLYMWSYFLQMALRNIGEKLLVSETDSVKEFINFMNCFELTFRPYSIYKIPATIIASGWHYLYRVRPFCYEPPQVTKTNHLIRNVFILVLIVVLINCLYGVF